MCGIIGIFAYGDPGKTWPDESLDAMLGALSHRGPDDRGKYVSPGLFMGHTRLSIIDLSSAGHQPMVSPDGRYVICFNGEIYNFRQLRGELESRGHRFHSRSDTEVLLAAWAEWGEGCLERLDGIFAFAIFDTIGRKLCLARDHLGVKPLFYWTDSQNVAFSSEPLAMFGPVIKTPDPDPSDLDAYFTFNYLNAPRAGLKGVKQVPPGSLCVIDNQRARVRRYWMPRYDGKPQRLTGALGEQFMELLNESVNIQMVSDTPLGMFLSGGLDSFAVATAAVSAGAKPVAYTLGFNEKEFDEAPAARTYAEYLGVKDRTSIFRWTEQEIYDTLGAMRELLADASCFAMRQLCKFAREDVKVALAGDGGDEIMAGYDTYRAGELTGYIRMLPLPLRRVILGAAPLLPSDNKRYGLGMLVERLISAANAGPRRDHASFRRIFSGDMKKRLYDPEFYRAVEHNDPIGEYAGIMEDVPKTRSYLTMRQHADIMFHLPSILAKVDRMSMSNGLEVRVPLLRVKMLDFCLNLPDEAKRIGGKGKIIMREALSPRIPESALRRPKAGFLPPVDKWFRHDGPMSSVFASHLDAASTNIGWLNWSEVRKLWAEHKRGRANAGFALLGILQFINWSGKCRT